MADWYFYVTDTDKFKHPGDCVCNWCSHVRRIEGNNAEGHNPQTKDPNQSHMKSVDDGCWCTAGHVCKHCNANSNESVREDMADPTPVKSKKDEIIEWRRLSFRDLGFSKEEALELAKTKIELGAARNLYRDGCPLDLIKRILAGTSFMGEEEDHV